MDYRQTGKGRGCARGYDISEAMRRTDARGRDTRENNREGLATARTWAFAFAASLAINAAMLAPFMLKAGKFALWMKGGAL